VISAPLYAGIVSRGVAFIIDAALTVLAALGFAVCVGLLHAVFSGGFTGPVSILRPGPVFAAVPLLFGLYCVAGWALTGMTVGKAVFGLRVVDHRGTHPSILRSIVRLLGYLVSAICWLGFAWIAIDARHDGFHDKIARTHVIYN
jgi:uncharacterized RDD family membrane protein YckC